MAGNMEDARRELDERAREPGTLRINGPVFSDRGTSRPACRGFWRVTLVSIELTLTDDFIDPHRDAADVIFRIGALTDSSFHARVFGQQFYHLAASPDYLQNMARPRGRTISAFTTVWFTAARPGLTAG